MRTDRTQRTDGTRIEAVDPQEFVALATSRRRLERADDEPDGCRALYDSETDTTFVVEDMALCASSIHDSALIRVH